MVLITFQTNCKREWFHRITYDGHVYNKNGTPAPNVLVLLQACYGNTDTPDLCSNNKYTVGQYKTDATGHFHIHADAAKSNNYFITFNNIGCNLNGVTATELTTLYTRLTIE